MNRPAATSRAVVSGEAGAERFDCCGSHTSRWLVAVIVCASITLTVQFVTLTFTTWSGPIYVTFQVIMICASIALIVAASLRACCRRSARPAAVVSVAYVVLTLATIIALSSSVDEAARYSCSFQMKCDYTEDLGVLGSHCSSRAKRYVFCFNPDEKRNGDLYYSKSKDDCEFGGGDDDTCRGFNSIGDCVRYQWPDDDDDECSNDTSTVTESVVSIAVSLSIFLVFAAIPALGTAIAILGYPAERPAATAPPPLAQCVEIELGRPRPAQPAPTAPEAADPNEPVAKLINLS